MRTRQVTMKGVAASRSDALALIGEPGDLALVERGKLRAIAIQCPDGCGEKLTINLDPDAGKAWRLYQDRDHYTLYPSVWRTTGCRSHFIIWGDQIYWMDSWDPRPSRQSLLTMRSEILARVSSDDWVSVERLAFDVGENPWLVARVCQELRREGVLEESEERDSYRRTLRGGGSSF